MSQVSFFRHVDTQNIFFGVATSLQKTFLRNFLSERRSTAFFILSIFFLLLLPFCSSVFFFSSSSSSGLLVRAYTFMIHHCPYCDYSSHRKWNVSAHIRTHTAEKPFECFVCKRRFTQRSTLTRHVRSQHELISTLTKKRHRDWSFHHKDAPASSTQGSRKSVQPTPDVTMNTKPQAEISKPVETFNDLHFTWGVTHWKDPGLCENIVAGKKFSFLCKKVSNGSTTPHYNQNQLNELVESCYDRWKRKSTYDHYSDSFPEESFQPSRKSAFKFVRPLVEESR